MKRFLKLLYSSKLLWAVLILLQLGFISAVFYWLSDIKYYIYSAFLILDIVLIVYEVNRIEDPGFKLTWVILIAGVPTFGAVLYLFLHNNWLTRRIADKRRHVEESIKPFIQQDENVKAEFKAEHPTEVGVSEYLYNTKQFPVYKNSSVRYFDIGEKMFEELKDELRSAQKFIFIEMYIINPSGKMWPEILEILKEKVKSGVEVRLLYDGMGCLNLLKNDYPEYLNSIGIKCKVFAPVMPLLSTYQNNRDHRKIVVIDGKVAFTGGINFADEYINEIVRFGHWKDTAVKIIGTAVSEFTSIFLQTWNSIVYTIGEDDFEKYISVTNTYDFKDGEGYVMPFADSPYTSDRLGESIYLNNINSAQTSVHIMTPYLVLTSKMVDALKFAAKRGVDVKIILPHIPDKAYAFYLAGTYYKELMSAGVKIYEYLPGFVHAKVSLSDSKRAAVGTINHDFRSLYLNYECSAYFVGVPEINDMENDFNETLKQCILITEAEYKSRSAFKRLLGKLIRLVAPLL